MLTAETHTHVQLNTIHNLHAAREEDSTKNSSALPKKNF